MATQHYPVTPIEGFMPEIDARNSQRSHVLDGANYVFDSLGPKSAFASGILTPFPATSPVDVQSVSVLDTVFVCTGDAILHWRINAPATWDLLAQFDTVIPGRFRDPWHAISIGGDIYLSQRFRGILKSEYDGMPENLRFRPVTESVVAGLPRDVRSMGLVRNRAILVTDAAIYWSNTGDLSDLTPELGGAGLQLISSFAEGDFKSLTVFEEGFIVWTDGGSVVAEYIGGDAVWRFFAGISSERPLNPKTTVKLSNGQQVFLSARGLMIANAGKSPTAWTQEFNEFLRVYISENNINPIHWRLEYDSSSEQVYLLESADGEVYTSAFVLTPTINKWGVFSEFCYGVLGYSSDLFGYVDRLGFFRYFNQGRVTEIEPDNAAGMNRLIPIRQKQLRIPSSSMVCRDVDWDQTQPMPTDLIRAAGWYVPGIAIPALPHVGVARSWIEIGYMRDIRLSESVDGEIEVQEIALGSIPSAAPTPMDYTTEWNADNFYIAEEDWDTELVLTPQDKTIDLLLGSGNRDRLYAIGQSRDLLRMDHPVTAYAEVPVSEDWNDSGDAEDWNSAVSGIPQVGAAISMQSSQDGITFALAEPLLSKFNTALRSYSVLSSGSYHRLRLDNVEVNGGFHVKYLGLTIQYGGQGV